MPSASRLSTGRLSASRLSAGRLRALRHLGVLALTLLITLLTTATPAAAHAGGLTATDSRGRVVSITPAIPGLDITTIENGARLRLRNGTTVPIAVSATQTVPPGETLIWADDRATPDGRRVPAGHTVGWTISLTANGTPITVTGVLTGEKPPLAPAWWAAAALTGIALVALSRRLRRGDLLLAGAGVIAAAASIVHVTGSTLAVESAPLPGTFLSAAGINLLAWPLLIGGAVTTLRGRAAGVLAVCAGAALTAVFVLPDVTSFHRAVIPFAGPPTVERLLVVLALGLGAGVAVAGAGVLRTLAQTAAAQATTAQTDAQAATARQSAARQSAPQQDAAQAAAPTDTP